jgi:hypothetical protein
MTHTLPNATRRPSVTKDTLLKLVSIDDDTETATVSWTQEGRTWLCHDIPLSKLRTRMVQ